MCYSKNLDDILCRKYKKKTQDINDTFDLTEKLKLPLCYNVIV
jgi:hypothetical protein